MKKKRFIGSALGCHQITILPLKWKIYNNVNAMLNCSAKKTIFQTDIAIKTRFMSA